MSNRVQVPDFKIYAEDEDLRHLLEKYLQKTEELQHRENNVLRQIELMQSAVTSLQEWSKSRKASRSSSEPVKMDIWMIEKETNSIREETKRIQKEIEEKMIENKKLEEEVIRRKRLQSNDFRISVDNNPTSDENPDVVENGSVRESDSPDQDSDSGIVFFDDKLLKLKEMEWKQMKESELKSDELKMKQKNMKDKIELLEWESRIDRQIIALRKKNGKE